MKETDSKGPEDVKASIPQAWRDASVLPLWLSRTAHRPPPPPPPPSHWQWARLSALLKDAQEQVNTEMVERRVLQLMATELTDWSRESTCGQILGAIQCLLPGERARPHRHTMQALRFMLEGSGAVTVVNGKHCPMEFGDLILTPSMAWHEHYHDGQDPVLWLDVLDVPLHIALQTIKFEPGPPPALPPLIPDKAFAPGMIPYAADGRKSGGDLYRYAYRDASRALEACPITDQRIKELRYINPETGDAALHTLSCALQQVERDLPMRTHRQYADQLFCVVEGEGYSEIGGHRVDWSTKGLFTVPRGQWVRHVPSTDQARFFVVSNAPLMRWLGCYEIENGSQ
ncbi:MAG: cupin domain-containing protein [Pigmentiphaga sp.]